MSPRVRACLRVCVKAGEANYSWGLSWWFPCGSLARWIQALLYPPPPSLRNSDFYKSKTWCERLLSLVSCPRSHYERWSEKPVRLAPSSTPHSVAYLNVSRICKLTLINGFNRKDFLFLVHGNKRQGINRAISIQPFANSTTSEFTTRRTRL